MKLQFKSIFWKLTLPVIVVGLLTVVILSFVIPSQIKHITVDNAISEAEKTVSPSRRLSIPSRRFWRFLARAAW